MGIHSAHAQSDPDLPPVPVPGPPSNDPPCYNSGGVCLHDWNKALAVFFEQKACVDLEGKAVIGVSPFDNDPSCHALAYLTPGQILPYHKTDEKRNWFDDIPVNTQFNGIIAVGLQCYYGTCGNAPEAVANGPGDVLWRTGSTVASAKNNDPGGPGLHVNKDTCSAIPGQPFTVRALDDTRIFLDNTATQPGVTSGTYRLYGKQFEGIRDQYCPAGGYAFANDQWFFAMNQFPLAAEKQDPPPMSGSILTLVHTGSQSGCHLEQEYYVREMGKVRHEAYANLWAASPGVPCYSATQRQNYQDMHGQLAMNPGDCTPLALNPPPPAAQTTWVEYNCAAYVRSAPPLGNGNPDNDPQKAIDILTASNLASVIFNVLPSDNPSIASISPPSIVQGDTKTPLTLSGSFSVNPWFGNHVTAMFSGGGGVDMLSSVDATSGGGTVTFTISKTDWDDSGLQCNKGPAYVRIFDGVSTSNTVPLLIDCSP